MPLFLPPTNISAFGLTLIDDADAATARATLGANGLFAIATSDLSRNNAGTGTTLTDDPVMTLAVPGAGVWKVTTLALFVNDSATPGVKGTHTFSGTKTNGGGTLETTTWSTSHYYSPDPYDTYFEWTAWSTAGFSSVSYFYEFVFTSTTSGTLTFQWAQDTASADNTKRWRGSYIQAQRAN